MLMLFLLSIFPVFSTTFSIGTMWTSRIFHFRLGRSSEPVSDLFSFSLLKSETFITCWLLNLYFLLTLISISPRRFSLNPCSCAITAVVALICVLDGEPWLSIRDAVLMVSPNLPYYHDKFGWRFYSATYIWMETITRPHYSGENRFLSEP